VTAWEELYAYATVAFRDDEVPEVVDRYVTRLIDAFRAEVLAEAADAIEAVDPAEWALAGQHAGHDAANLIRRLAQQPTTPKDTP
jgi:L-alanine-DL-glutamate epimerase-like enolase superfamily enzyme